MTISKIILVCRELDRLCEFYRRAFGFVQAEQTKVTDPAFGTLIGVPGAQARVAALRLGRQLIEVVEIAPHGRRYPAEVQGWSPLFQHFAIVVSDIDVAYARLREVDGWTAISRAGPQTLPLSSGGVTAFKFRDPEGHPLELIAFPSVGIPRPWRGQANGIHLGIDHSAISVADTGRSVAFYAQFGLQRVGGSENFGPEQERLDNIRDAHVTVTALADSQSSPPHLELLCYRGNFDRGTVIAGANDVAATRLVLESSDRRTFQALIASNEAALVAGPVELDSGTLYAMLHDPDGHLLHLQTQSGK